MARRRFGGMAMIILLIALSLPNRALAQIRPIVPQGFHAGIYARGFINPTALTFGPDGRWYVAQQNGAIFALARGRSATIATGFGIPLGLAWHAHKLYVSSSGEVSTLTPSGNYRSFRRRVVISGLPIGKHQNDSLAFHDGWLYIGVGSTCNACRETDPRSATIMVFRPNGSHGRVFARGLRNPYGLAFRPHTGPLYATDNGRDDFDDQVPDELNLIKDGGNYGWPDCWGRNGGSNCRGTIPPVALFEPHASADGLVFYHGHTFPKRYRNDAFVAEWGDSVNALDTGHRVKDVHFAGKRVIVSNFATGLSHPLAVAVGGKGALLVADWGTGIIWRIQANGH
jgi:glucose/arabinose dehydrogenase